MPEGIGYQPRPNWVRAIQAGAEGLGAMERTEAALRQEYFDRFDPLKRAQADLVRSQIGQARASTALLGTQLEVMKQELEDMKDPGGRIKRILKALLGPDATDEDVDALDKANRVLERKQNENKALLLDARAASDEAAARARLEAGLASGAFDDILPAVGGLSDEEVARMRAAGLTEAEIEAARRRAADSASRRSAADMLAERGRRNTNRSALASLMDELTGQLASSGAFAGATGLKGPLIGFLEASSRQSAAARAIQSGAAAEALQQLGFGGVSTTARIGANPTLGIPMRHPGEPPLLPTSSSLADRMRFQASQPFVPAIP